MRSASRVLRESVEATRATAPYLLQRRRSLGAAAEEEGEVLAALTAGLGFAAPG